MSNELAVERSKFRRRLKKMLLDDQEVINLADTMREEEEGFGASVSTH